MQISLIWLDRSIDAEAQKQYQATILSKFSDVAFTHVKSDLEAIERIRQSVKAILITGSSDADSIIPKYINGLAPVSNLHSIIVFASSGCPASDFSQYEKVRLASADFEEVLAQCEECLHEASRAQQEKE